MEELIVVCPNCNEFVFVKEINCGIFRHAAMKDSGEQIDPHSTKEKCEDLKKRDLIYGCGKPFRISVSDNGEINIQTCDYI